MKTAMQQQLLKFSTDFLNDLKIISSLSAYNYCLNNGGCSHLCLPRVGGFSCRCPDAAAADGQCVEGNA